ncbi:phage tail tape measure protein [Maridesulfovibrio bastinii]|uniref:phage tail tape measure protein n=1 Tax=Maridesulfovibrio bastinii TaxID=47157 RepID=UPI0003F5684D|nr:phage tail tape measure protein [Maridesulfovibrio bastinii]
MEVFSVLASMSLVDMVTQPLRSIQAQMGKVGSSASALDSRMRDLAKGMLPLVAVAGGVIASLAGTAMATVPTQKALGELSSVGIRDFAALENAATAFSNEFSGTTKPDFLYAAYDIKSGISSLTDAGVAGFTSLSALTAKATKATVGEMTSLFATGYGIYKGYYSQMSDVQFGEMFSAGIAASVKSFKTNGSQMSQSISSLGATATNANVPLEEQLAILGTLQATMPGAEAATKYKAFLNAAAGAGEKLGLSFLDSNGQLLSTTAILDKLRGKFGPTMSAAEKMDIKKAFGTDEAVAYLDLLYSKTSQLCGGISDVAAAMAQGDGFTRKMAETMNNDLGATMAKIGQQIHNLVEIIGNAFAPTLNLIISALSPLIIGLQKLAGTMVGRTIIQITSVLAMGVLAVVAYAAASWLLAAGMSAVTVAMAPVGAAVAAITWPIWLVIAAVAALWLAFKTNFGGIADFFNGIWDKVSLVAAGVRAVLGSVQNGVGEIKGELAADIETAGLLGVVTIISRVIYRVMAVSEGFSSALSGVWSMISSAFLPVINALGDAFSSLFSILGSISGMFGKVISATDAGPWRTLGTIVGSVVRAAFWVLGTAIRIALTPLTLVIKIVGLVLKALVGLASYLPSFGTIIGSVFQGILSFFGGLWDGVLSGLSMMTDGIKWAFLNLTPVGWLIQAFSGITSFFDGLSLRDAGAKLIGTLVDGIKSMIMAPVDAVTSVFDKIRDLWPFSNDTEEPVVGNQSILGSLSAGAQTIAPRLAHTAAGALAGVSLAVSPVAAANAEIQPQIPPAHVVQTQPVQAPALPSLAAKAAWQTQPVQAPVLPDLAASAAWQAQPVQTPILTDLAAKAAWQTQPVQAPVLTDLTANSAWQTQPVQTPILTDLAAKAAWQTQPVQTPVLPDLAASAAWQTQSIQAPVLPDQAAKAAWQTQPVQASVLSDLSASAAWQTQAVQAPALPDLTANAAWQAQDIQAPTLPDLSASASWQAESVQMPQIPSPELPNVANSSRPVPAGHNSAVTLPRGKDHGKNVTISIQNLNLPGVSDVNDFRRELLAIVEEHDG